MLVVSFFHDFFFFFFVISHLVAQGEGDANGAGVAGLIVAGVLSLLEHALSVAHLVLHKMVGADEAVAADGAGELLLAGVGASVARQLVGAREAALAALDGAGVGALAWKKEQCKYNGFQRKCLLFSPVWFL